MCNDNGWYTGILINRHQNGSTRRENKRISQVNDTLIEQKMNGSPFQQQINGLLSSGTNPKYLFVSSLIWG